MKLDELIQKRDETADVLIEITGCSKQEAIDKANDYVNRKYMNVHRHNSSDSTIVELYTDEHGEKWIRIKAWDEDFLLSLFDMRDGDKEEFTWEEAMKLAKKNNQNLPSKKQWMIIDVLRDDIDKIIKDNDGDKLERWYWSSSVAQYNSYFSWLYYGNSGLVLIYNKYYYYGGRALVYLS